MELAYIPSPSHGVYHLGPIPLRGYAFCIIIGVFVAVWLGNKRWIARGGRAEQLEGDGWATRRVVIEFDTYEQALACYRSAEYQEACGHRQTAARAEIFIVEGL